MAMGPHLKSDVLFAGASVFRFPSSQRLNVSGLAGKPGAFVEILHLVVGDRLRVRLRSSDLFGDDVYHFLIRPDLSVHRRQANLEIPRSTRKVGIVEFNIRDITAPLGSGGDRKVLGGILGDLNPYDFLT